MAYIDGNGNMRDGSPEPYDMTNGQGYDSLCDEDIEPVWTMRGGRRIRIVDMDNEHLLNTDRAIRAGTARADQLMASLIYGEIVRRGLTPKPEFACREEARATACVSALHTFFPRLKPWERVRLGRLLAFESGDGDENVFLDPEQDTDAFAVCHAAVREFFRLRFVISDNDAVRDRLDQVLETWLERQWDR
jgi:hypothetical protein